jgi:hypothetical protein
MLLEAACLVGIDEELAKFSPGYKPVGNGAVEKKEAGGEGGVEGGERESKSEVSGKEGRGVTKEQGQQQGTEVEAEKRDGWVTVSKGKKGKQGR